MIMQLEKVNNVEILTELFIVLIIFYEAICAVELKKKLTMVPKQ